MVCILFRYSCLMGKNEEIEYTIFPPCQPQAGQISSRECGSKEARQEAVNEVFEVEGRRVLVEDIPTRVCSRCGEPTFSRETTERIRRMVHEEARPVRSEVVEVFEYA